MVAALRRVELALDRRQCVAGRKRLGAHRSNRLLELLELPLSGENSVQIAVRREEMDRLRRDEMPLPFSSSRAIERRTTSDALMCRQSSATRSALHVISRRDCR